MEQVKTFRNDLSHMEDLDRDINAWIEEAGVRISSIHHHVYDRKNHIGIHSPLGVLTTVVYEQEE